MKRSRLRRYAGMRYALLDPILEELAREGKIRIDEEVIILNAPVKLRAGVSSRSDGDL
jgi:hypothetical protein